MARRGHRGRVDGNHGEIVAALRQMGCSVQSLGSIGQGCPDLLVGLGGRNVLLEVKQPKGTLKPSQGPWLASWRGAVCVVRSVEEAVQAVTGAREGFTDDNHLSVHPRKTLAEVWAEEDDERHGER